jgi:hypothetical protein
MSLLDKLRALATGPPHDGEVSRDSLVREVARGILDLRRRGTRGVEEFPVAVKVQLGALPGELAVVRAWTEDPAFDREIDARLLNELAQPGELPARRYDFSPAGAGVPLVVEERHAIAAVLVVVGGDRDGSRYPIAHGRREWRAGRGAWHGDTRLPNDIVLAEEARWLSRAAAVLHRAGAMFEVEARDQGEHLVVLSRDAAPRRPAMTAAGRAPAAVGDRIVFHDGSLDERAGDAVRSITLRLDPPPGT